MATSSDNTAPDAISSPLIVVALDLGTTYSGYAFSFIDRPDEILTNGTWNSQKYHLASIKTPTCLMINKTNKDDYRFGYEAEDDYADMQTESTGEADNYFFFDRFKMELHVQKEVSEQMLLYDVKGQSLPAIEVFSTAIKALKEHLWTIHIEKNMRDIKMQDIKWVLTIPAIWSAKSKLFMRRCAEMAGIQSKRLCIALEPEAAALYCQQKQRTIDEYGAGRSIAKIGQGANYLVIDIGGGTVDIIAHKKIIHDKVEELCSASGNDCGGTRIDREFMQMIKTIVGKNVMEGLKKEYTLDYIDFIRVLEIFKRGVGNRKKATINMSIPVTALNDLCKKFGKGSFSEAVSQSDYKNDLHIKANVLQVQMTLAREKFKSITDKIVKEIENVLARIEGLTIDTFYVVGGCSESSIIQEAIKDSFKSKHIVTPEEPILAVLKGAVLFGHTPDFVTSRVTRFAYGRRIRPIFNELAHDINRKVESDGEFRCTNVFDLLMRKNTKCAVGSTQSIEYHTYEQNQAKVTVAVYVSENDSTKYVDGEGCEKLGELVVDIPNPTSERRHVHVDFYFGGTELVVTATVKGEMTPCTAQFELI
ncbi:heat shock 70 kDa protein 12B-like isoform X2 [Mytilus californianus]|uniref:heat shock 70 kDa protein 12B-like isoform X2 n=1 Tax=Mytilus californianus TaxID=6549 RepID=UPI002248231D|nr:heat shock 70 kDa protein 12B-like isoform X2 [Mytilus californianus]